MHSWTVADSCHNQFPPGISPALFLFSPLCPHHCGHGYPSLWKTTQLKAGLMVLHYFACLNLICEQFEQNVALCVFICLFYLLLLFSFWANLANVARQGMQCCFFFLCWVYVHFTVLIIIYVASFITSGKVCIGKMHLCVKQIFYSAPICKVKARSCAFSRWGLKHWCVVGLLWPNLLAHTCISRHTYVWTMVYWPSPPCRNLIFSPSNDSTLQWKPTLFLHL